LLLIQYTLHRQQKAAGNLPLGGVGAR